MLGAVAKATGIVKLESIVEVVKEYFSAKMAEKNVMAVMEAYEKTEEAR